MAIDGQIRHGVAGEILFAPGTGVIVSSCSGDTPPCPWLSVLWNPSAPTVLFYTGDTVQRTLPSENGLWVTNITDPSYGFDFGSSASIDDGDWAVNPIFYEGSGSATLPAAGATQRMDIQIDPPGAGAVAGSKTITYGAQDTEGGCGIVTESCVVLVKTSLTAGSAMTYWKSVNSNRGTDKRGELYPFGATSNVPWGLPESRFGWNGLSGQQKFHFGWIDGYGYVIMMSYKWLRDYVGAPNTKEEWAVVQPTGYAANGTPRLHHQFSASGWQQDVNWPFGWIETTETMDTWVNPDPAPPIDY